MNKLGQKKMGYIDIGSFILMLLLVLCSALVDDTYVYVYVPNT